MSDLDNLSEKGASSAQENGQLLKRRRLELGLTLTEVTARSTVPTVAYLGSLEAGRNNVAKSKHLPSLARALELSEGDLARVTGRPMLSALVDVRQPTRLNVATVVAGGWQGSQAGAYTLDEAPGTVLVVDPAQRALAVGRHYVVLVPATGQVVRSVGVEVEGTVQMLQNSQVLAPDEVQVLGRVVHEGRAL
ncbi:helix-turn-helix transcriptional regulator [Deinococcus sp. NW-56]|uniref:helix-turn-helix domain-containing protein n=1 Tax=Deinococcus sp. NW-56 TaxID=2080419 RepID=UPI000CF52602|nr:helix-turn-helix transcriptional regulator [Deinococcus sp. NW-56]